MKKNFNSWKLLTLLSALIFAASCWYVVYANGFWAWHTSNMWNILYESNWNSLMNNLWIPSWAIVAFNRSCPSWRTRLSDADGKFLQGSSSYSTNGGYWRWSSTHTLTTSEMPSHSHYVVRNYHAGTSEHWLEDSSYSTYTITSSVQRDDDTDYSMKVVTSSANAWKSSSEWWGSSFSIMNPYIKVVYCVKNAE